MVLAHATHLYLDHPHEPDGDEPGLFWATRSIGTKKAFSYIPGAGHTNSTYIARRVCDLFQMKKCLNLTRPENIIGRSDIKMTAAARVREPIQTIKSLQILVAETGIVRKYNTGVKLLDYVSDPATRGEVLKHVFGFNLILIRKYFVWFQ